MFVLRPQSRLEDAEQTERDLYDVCDTAITFIGGTVKIIRVYEQVST